MWAVDVYGKVYSLCTTRGRWQQCKDDHLELKRITASDMCCWAIGFDQQVYLNVLPNDVIIRHQEETYENQRWNPVDGYTDALLPTDRWSWTDEFGTKPQPLHSFHLPSENWEWEGDWYVDDESCGRESTSAGGWEYAVDFPTTFTKEKKWNSCVRRRRWLRYRRYKALGLWAKVPLDSGRPPSEPFTDISCGGWEMSVGPEKPVSLWAVSQQGKVWFRSGIHQQNPEGTVWENVPVPDSTEVAQISAGPGDLLWIVLWDGQLLVRMGIHKHCRKGASWVVVDPPCNTKVIHVAVGISVVWAITKDKKVWFRRGVNSHNATGLGWISVGGEMMMMMISMGPSDQLWGVGSEDRSLYFRHGVTPTEVTGRAWVLMCAHVDNSHSISSPSDVCLITAQSAAPTQGSVLSCDDLGIDNIPKAPSDRSASPEMAEHGASLPQENQKKAKEAGVPRQNSLLNCSQLTDGELPWSNVDLAEMKVLSANAAEKSVAVYPMELGETMKQDEQPPWAWITAGQCEIDPNTNPSWLEIPDAETLCPSINPAFAIAGARGLPADRTQQEKGSTNERSVTVKKIIMCWLRDWQPHQWEEVWVTLEQVRGGEAPHDDVVYIYYTHNQERKYLYAAIKDVTALVPVHLEPRIALAIYTAERTRQRWPILLATESQKDMESWLSLLNESCCESRALQDPPSKQALWAVTTKGDIMVHEPSPCLEAPAQYLPCEQMFWRQVPGHLLSVECNSLGVVWGIGYDHTAWVYTKGHGENQVQEDKTNPQTLTDVRSVYIYENQRWNPVTGYTNKGLPTDRYMWSDALGLKECTKDGTKPPSPEWKWVSDWVIDYSVPGGTDKEGWQYAADFPVTFHGNKTMKDFVRRRRWVRKCKITITGPWQKVPPIPLIDVTILPCLAQSSLEQVPLWAISEKGDVLCRIGVTAVNPAGSTWLHVGTDQPFKSISIGGGHQVWAIARDGAVFYRGSVSAQNPAGECWYHIPSPNKQTLRQVSVGRTSVYAVDETGNLWYRQGLTPSYPQGSAWELICGNVCKVSIGPLDQVWIIADKVPGHPTETPGTVCHRLGVRPMHSKGLSWDFGIGGGWGHLSVRGNSTEAQRALPPSPQTSRSQEQVNGKVMRCSIPH